MKTIIVCFSICMILLSSCASYINMQILKPAQITLPAHIKKLAVANRSLPSKNEKLSNIVEGVLTGEGIMVDRQASENCIKGLSQFMDSSPRFTLNILGNVNLSGTGTSQFPPPLDWDKVEKLCKINHSDALVILETFDSDIARKVKSEERTKEVEGKKVKYTVFTAYMDITINTGWRIYDLKNKTIIDENVYLDRKGWQEEGETEEQAIKKLPPVRNAVVEAGFLAGKQYGFRISPAWINVKRKYYTSGNDAMKEATRMVKTNQWDKAAKIWYKYAKTNDKKIGKRATYNLALYYEQEGDLQQALKWAKISYNKYYNKSAKYYINILNNRIIEQEKLKEQLK